jgi:hypothetical protein
VSAVVQRNAHRARTYPKVLCPKADEAFATCNRVGFNHFGANRGGSTRRRGDDRMGEPSDEPHAEQGAGVAPEAGVGLAHPSRVQFSHSKTDVTALSSDLHPSDVPGEQRLLSRESGRCEGDLMGVRARRRALPRARSTTSQQEQRQRQPPRRRSSHTPGTRGRTSRFPQDRSDATTEDHALMVVHPLAPTAHA